MIADALIFLKNQLNAFLTIQSEEELGSAQGDKVVFIDGEQMDPVSFKPQAVSALLINVEEENVLRPADRFVARSSDGTVDRVEPEIRLNLYVLFAARFKKYEKGLRQLSRIISYFQSYRHFDRQGFPELSGRIDHLVVELTTLPFSEQNEIWSALRTTYLPSVLYRVKMLVFRHEHTSVIREVKEREIEISQ